MPWPISNHESPDTNLAICADEQDPAGAFARALVDCLHAGVTWFYRTHTGPTSFPRGRLQFSETVRLMASRGIRHRVITTIPVRAQQTDLVRVVRAASACVAEIPSATPKIKAEVEALLVALDPAVPFQSIADAISTAELVRASMFADGHLAAMHLTDCSIALLRRQYEVGGRMQPIAGGFAHFKNLEELWERCVLRLIECCPIIQRQAAVGFHGLSGSGLRLFDDGGPELDPDIATFQSGSVAAIVDAKYKRIDAEAPAAASDLYQLTAYVRRTAAAI
jgi:5-methylcytosine-specific restriction endonuclease McrBC regulatory subunit McrC